MNTEPLVIYPAGTPTCVKDVVGSVVSEWGVLTNTAEDVTVEQGLYSTYNVLLSAPAGDGFDYGSTFLMRVGEDDGSVHRFNYCYSEQVVGISGSWRGSSPSIQDVMCELCVEDITNIQPHEYGLLKLKFGFGKRDIFVPSVIIKQYSTENDGRYTINSK